MSFARNFAAGQQIAQTAMDAFDQARLGKILSETKDAKVQDLAPVEDVQAVPVEQIQNQQPQIASADQPFLTPDSIGEATATEPKRTQVSPKQYKFLDKTYDAPLTDEQTKAARADSLKTRMSELFNPVRGLKQVRELELQDQEDFKFGLFKTEAKRKQDDQAREDAADEAERSAFSKTSMGIAVADYARGIEEFNKAKAARDKAIQEGASPDSLPPMPAMPAMREISVADSLKDSINLQLARVQAGGRMNQEKLAQFVQAYQKANDEGYTRALTAANDGAPIERVADLFNKAGKFKFDPSNVVGDDWTTDQYGAKQRVISVYDPETKKTSKINVGAELASLGQAGAQLDKLYKLSQINANNATIDLRKAQTGLYGAQLGATNAQEAERRARALLAENKAHGTVPSGSGSSTGNAQQDARLKDFDKSFDGFKDTNNPSLRTDAYRIGKEALGRNPGADPSLVAYAAQAYVTGSTKNIQPKLDFDTGEAVAVFTDDRTGKTVTLHSVKPTKEQVAALKPEVQVYLQQQEALGKQLTGKAGFADAMRRAAINPKDAEAMRSVEQVIALQAIPIMEAELLSRWEIVNAREKAMKRDPLPKPTRQDAMDLAMRQLRSPDGMARLRRRLDLIRTYGQ